MISEDLKLVPGVFQRIFEMIVEFIFDLIKQQIGKGGYYYSLLYLFYLILYYLLFIKFDSFWYSLTSHLIMIL